MDKTKESAEGKPEWASDSKLRRHPLTTDNPKHIMFERMATVEERIAKFEEKLNADREKNAR